MYVCKLEINLSFLSNPVWFWGQGLSLGLGLAVIWRGRLASEIQKPTCLYLPSTGITSARHAPGSNLGDKHFTN